jgi:DNA-binding transcriptional ArsR family regulator
MSPNRRVTDVAALKAMAHPLRLRLYYALALAGSATSTRLAEQVDESVSLVSYHLRQLALHGYVEDDPEPLKRDGRQRWWRPTSVGFNWTPSDFGDGPDGVAAVAQADRQMDAHRAAYRQAWLDSRAGWSKAWQDAAVTTDNPLMRMTPAELTEFSGDYVRLMQGWRDRLAAAADDPGREQVMVALQAFPFRP